MRFMILVKATKDSEAGVLPDEQLLTEMGKFNEELVKAGIMLDGEGLHPSPKARGSNFPAARGTVIDGPFAETKELIAGYWIWRVKSKEEAIEWVKQCPNPMPGWRVRSTDLRRRGLRPGIHTRVARTGSGDSAPGRAVEEISLLATRRTAKDDQCPESERSAWMTSMRDARDAGMSEARTAAPTSSAAAPSTGTTPGI